MKKLLLLLLFVSATLSAQDVKLKKGVAVVDKTEYLKYDDAFNNVTVSTLDGKEIAIIKEYSFEKPRKKNPNNPQDWRYGDTETVKYFVVSFVGFSLEFETDLSLKKLFGAFYKYELIKDGQVAEEQAKKIAAKISKEISGERPIIVLTN